MVEMIVKERENSSYGCGVCGKENDKLLYFGVYIAVCSECLQNALSMLCLEDYRRRVIEDK